jgi:hypothetical protein
LARQASTGDGGVHGTTVSAIKLVRQSRPRCSPLHAHVNDPEGHLARPTGGVRDPPIPTSQPREVGPPKPQRRALCKKRRRRSRLALPNAIPANGAGPPGAATSQSSSDLVIRATPRPQPVGSSLDHTRRKERPPASFASSWMSSFGTLPPTIARCNDREQPAEDTSPGQPRWQRALQQGEVRFPPQERGSCWP